MLIAYAPLSNVCVFVSISDHVVQSFSVSFEALHIICTETSHVKILLNVSIVSTFKCVLFSVGGKET